MVTSGVDCTFIGPTAELLGLEQQGWFLEVHPGDYWGSY